MNKSEVLEKLRQIRIHCQDIERRQKKGTISDAELYGSVAGFIAAICEMEKAVSEFVYHPYREFLSDFAEFCGKCGEAAFFLANRDMFLSSLALMTECIYNMEISYLQSRCQCPCCKEEVFYYPAPGTGDPARDGQLCPVCGSDSRTRLMLAVLEKMGIREAAEGTSVLQIAPEKNIQNWMESYCPHLRYREMEIFEQDLEKVNEAGSDWYDVILYSAPIENIQRKKEVLLAVCGLLKPEGILVFMASGDIGLDIPGVYVQTLGERYLGEGAYERLGLTAEDVIYVVAKREEAGMELAATYSVSEEILENGPLVSVVMSCYNHEKYVGEAIESVIGQTYKNIEFLVADDGSTDDSVEIMKHYSEYFTEAYYFKDNICGRTKFLLEHVKGKYVAVMHSDDLWEPDKLAIQVEYLETHPDVPACFTWASYLNEKRAELPDTIFYNANRDRHEWMHNFWEDGNSLCHPSLVIRSDVYKKTGDTVYPHRQLPDFFRWVELVQHYDIKIIPKILTKMVRHTKGESKNASVKTADNCVRYVMEEAVKWPLVLERMEDGFFFRAFAHRLIRQDADSPEEAACEKFFLMRNSEKVWIQEGALCYFARITESEKVRECLESKYSYTRKDFYKDLVSKGWGAYMEIGGAEED